MITTVLFRDIFICSNCVRIVITKKQAEESIGKHINSPFLLLAR